MEPDAFARGGYSYLAVPDRGGTIGARAARRQLMDPDPTLQVFWAGEGTAPAYDGDYQPSSVHGAYISGVGVARRVWEYLTRLQ
ncbi:MAG: hypothetical protein EWM73_03049 [Nitrospira sp.]|nr:MAG: hypothetical protein EWM73_03049 [Nitrospira sp.]